MGLWESNLGFGDHVRAQAVDDDLLVINFIPLGVNFGLYRILQMIRIENLIREFTNKNMCLRQVNWGPLGIDTVTL